MISNKIFKVQGKERVVNIGFTERESGCVSEIQREIQKEKGSKREKKERDYDRVGE